MKRPLFFLVLLLALAGFSLAETGGNTNVEFFVYKASVGDVSFPHKKHTTDQYEDCGFCHSALRTFGGKMNELYGHNICLKCHETRSGPTACDQCHADYKGKVAVLK